MTRSPSATDSADAMRLHYAQGVAPSGVPKAANEASRICSAGRRVGGRGVSLQFRCGSLAGRVLGVENRRKRRVAPERDPTTLSAIRAARPCSVTAMARGCENPRTRLPGGPEDRLTSEFSRCLFDAGLSPLTKPLAAGLQPDLLDPLASFYVEAKQYALSSARGDIVKSVAQVLDTVGRLRGGPYAVDEAFCVVFRREGPYYDLPSVLQTETYRLYLVLVDLAPTTEAGRRQRDKPVQIPADEFFATAPVDTQAA